MKLSELISIVGDENIRVQNVIESMDSFKGGIGKPTLITFQTNAVTPAELLVGKPEMLGLVLWIPRDKLPQTLNKQG